LPLFGRKSGHPLILYIYAPLSRADSSGKKPGQQPFTGIFSPRKDAAFPRTQQQIDTAHIPVGRPRDFQLCQPEQFLFHVAASCRESSSFFQTSGNRISTSVPTFWVL